MKKLYTGACTDLYISNDTPHKVFEVFNLIFCSKFEEKDKLFMTKTSLFHLTIVEEKHV